MSLADERRDARERALGLLYEAETKGCTGTELLDQLPVPANDFAAGLVRAVDEHQVQIDGLLSEFSKGWTLSRMPALDRATLRMGTAELLTRPDVPTAVVTAIHAREPERDDLLVVVEEDEPDLVARLRVLRVSEPRRGSEHFDERSVADLLITHA